MDRNKKQALLCAAISCVLLIGISAYILLDTFVIEHVYSTVTAEASAAGSADELPSAAADAPADTAEAPVLGADPDAADTGSVPAAEANTQAETVITDTSYSDGNISIVITQYREYDSDIYVADIQLASPQYLKTALAKDSYGQNIHEPTSVICLRHNGILAINGDYYGAQEAGYVIRNGVLYRETGEDRDDMVIWADGSMTFINEAEISAAELLAQGAQQVLNFGPVLVSDGNTLEYSYTKPHNRTAVGYYDACHYCFVVADGRSDASVGLSYNQLAEFMQSLGVTDAYNLDGGGSSTLYFNGTLINHPTDDGTHFYERKVSDIVYIGYE